MMVRNEKSGSRVAIVTGATGFIGLHLTKRLLASGWETHVTALPAPDLARLDEISDRISIHVYDGTVESLFSMMEGLGGGTVFHLASLFLARHEPKDIRPLIESNMLFGSQLVEAMVANGVFRLVNTGTNWQHYNNKEYSPVCLYAATKQAFEAILQYYVEATPLRVINLKLFDVYGPSDTRPKLFSLLRRTAGEQEPLAMSAGEQLLDLVYVDDVVDAFVLAAERLASSNVEDTEEYAVSSGAPLKLKDVVELYSRVTGCSLPIVWGGRPYREREVMIPWNTGERLPGWRPKTGLEEGICRMEQSDREVT